MRGQWLVERVQQRLDPSLVDVCKASIDEQCLVPGRRLRVQDEEGHAAGEHIHGSRSVAVDLRHGELPLRRVRREAHVAEVAAALHLNDLARRAAGRALGLHDQARAGGHVALGRAVVVLPAQAEVPELLAARRAEAHRLAEVHEPELPAPQQQVLQGDVAVPDVARVQMPHGLQQLPHVAQDHRLRELAALRVALPLHAVEEVAPVAVLQHQPSELVVAEDAQHLEQEPALLRLPAQVGVHANLVERIFLSAYAAAESAPVVALRLGAAVHQLVAHDLRDGHLVLPPRAAPHMALHLAEQALLLPALRLREGALMQLLEDDVAVEVVEVRGAGVRGAGVRGRRRG
mmetsp:Transcript_137869/g.384435  ORF Transcript_137869/g.384435 Transcript_137869/m.384435 type:complete len:346 (-) Transcript_137869:44-1081(-)